MDILKKGRKGQAFFVGIMIAIMGIIVVFLFIAPLKDSMNTARDGSHLDCANESITTGQKMTCILVDMTMFYFVGIGLAVAISYIFVKRFLEQDFVG